MGAYLRLLGSLAQNLVRRVGEDLADCAVVCRRGVVYKLRSFRLRYDDVGPTSAATQDCQLQPEKLAALVESVKNKPWFCELDRKTAQDLVRDGGPGCFLIRPSASTKSLTLTLWHRHRAYNILIRQREDGLLALGSTKDHEMTFHTVEEMVRFYEQEPLILYSGGELTGKTKLKAPPPGLVCNCGTDLRRDSSLVSKRLSEDFQRPSTTRGLRTLSAGSVEVPFRTGNPKDLNNSRPSTTTRLRTLSSGNVEFPFSSSGGQFEFPQKSSHSFSSTDTFPTSIECKSDGDSLNLSNNATKDVQERVEISSSTILSRRNDFTLTHTVPINKRLAISTPNIDLKTISEEVHKRRVSSENISVVKAPPDVPPRLPGSFKEIQNSSVIPRSASVKIDNRRFEQTRPLPLLPKVHTKVNTTNLSVSVASADRFDC